MRTRDRLGFRKGQCSEMTEATEAARQIVAEPENKLAAAEARAVELQTERRRLSFAANTGDGAAEKRLKALNTEAAHINLDIENVRSAIDEAKRRLAAAERDEAMAASVENAEAAPDRRAKNAVDRSRKRDRAGPENGYHYLYLGGSRGCPRYRPSCRRPNAGRRPPDRHRGASAQSSAPLECPSRRFRAADGSHLATRQ